MPTTPWPYALLPPHTMTFRLTTNTHSMMGLWKSSQDVEWPGVLWSCSVHFESLEPVLTRRVEAILAGLDGPVGRILIPDFESLTIAGGATGTLTATGTMLAKQVTIDGLGGTNPVFLAGDKMEIGERLYMCVEDANRSGATATVKVRPPLRVDYAAAPVKIVDPGTIMKLVDDRQLAKAVRSGRLADFDIDFTEVLP